MFFRGLRATLAVTAGLALAAVVVIEWLGMFGRYFGTSMPWAAEALNLITFWLVWPAIVLAQLKGAHYVVDLFGERLPSRIRTLRDVVLNMIILGYCGMVSYYAISSLAGPGQTLTYLSPLTHDWEVIAVPVGLVGVMIIIGRDLCRKYPFKREKPGDPETSGV